MATTYQYWQHVRSGEVWAVSLEDGRVVASCGPLEFAEYASHQPADYDINMEPDDNEWFAEHDTEFALREITEDDRVRLAEYRGGVGTMAQEHVVAAEHELAAALDELFGPSEDAGQARQVRWQTNAQLDAVRAIAGRYRDPAWVEYDGRGRVLRIGDRVMVALDGPKTRYRIGTIQTFTEFGMGIVLCQSDGWGAELREFVTRFAEQVDDDD